ncbi:MAG: OB-fold domain-containing protein [Ottowia sp.]|uniref:Zn-ribbon domain-containing OB-fold protein n=1 Tax=Ottowia sp. TaxID=1898956 RepID=UPI0039E57BCE
MTTTSLLPALDLGLPLLPEHEEFWHHCARRELRFQRCGACGAWQHPPAPVCPDCGSPERRWEAAPPIGELFSYTIVHHAPSPFLRRAVPYNIAVVSFPGLGDIRLVSQVLGVATDALWIGMPLRLSWREQSSGRWLPCFEPGDAHG